MVKSQKETKNKNEKENYEIEFVILFHEDQALSAFPKVGHK
jgi:hypothetical protein